MVKEENVMRITRFIVLAFAIISLNACQKNIGESPEFYEMTFYGINAPFLKTVLNYDSVLWESGDNIKVLWGNNQSSKATCTPYDFGRKAEITATVESASSYYGVYPYSATSSLSNGVLNVTVSSDQTGMFRDANIAVSKADAERNMSFRHLVSWLEFTIDTPGVLTFASDSSNPITGVITVDGFDENLKPVYSVSGTGSTVTIDVKSSGTYYIALLPDVTLEALDFTLNDGGNKTHIYTQCSLQMPAGKLLGLGNITEKFIKENGFGAKLESFVIEEFDFEY